MSYAAIERLERACIAGMDAEFRDDVQTVLDELARLRVDAERLDLLDQQRADDVHQVGEDDYVLAESWWIVHGQHADVRAAIDALATQEPPRE